MARFHAHGAAKPRRPGIACPWGTTRKATEHTGFPFRLAERPANLYFFASNNATLTCCEAKSGKVLIDAAKLADLQGVYASPVGVAGRIYVVGRNGVTAVLKAGAALEVLATNRLEDRIVRFSMHSADLAAAELTPDRETLVYLARFEKGYDLWKYTPRSKEIELVAPVYLLIKYEGRSKK